MKICAIIPAYNEERTIGNVIDTIRKVDWVSEIVVVSDGSVDKTAVIARDKKVKVIELAQNRGKGGAIKKGLEETDCDVVLFLDADLIGLSEAHIKKLLEPVIKSECDMCVGVFSKGRASTDLAQIITPQLSGQRAVKKQVVDSIERMELTGYGLEVTLTKYAKKHNLVVKEIKLDNVTHVTKEEKYGLALGFGKRMKMYWQICKGFKVEKSKE